MSIKLTITVDSGGSKLISYEEMDTGVKNNTYVSKDISVTSIIDTELTTPNLDSDYNFQWFIIDKPESSIASISPGSLNLKSITLENIDKWGTYRLFCVATANYSGSVEQSETNPLKSPESNYINISVQGKNYDLEKPATGQRDWHSQYSALVDTVEFGISSGSEYNIQLSNGSGSFTSSSWKIDSLNNLMPNLDSSYNIGSNTYKILNLHAVNITGSILGDVVGDLTGSVLGDVTGSVLGDVTGDLTGSVLGDVIGDLTGSVLGDVIGDLTGSVLGDVTGDLTGSVLGDVTGDLTGSVLGDVTGDLTGSVLGDVTGDLTGSVLGDVTGDLTGSVLGDVTGDLTGSVLGDVTGDLTGSVLGDVTGDLTGSVLGDVIGDLTGSVLGNVTGDLTGSLTGSSIDVDTIIFGATEVTASGAEINHLSGVTSPIQAQIESISIPDKIEENNAKVEVEDLGGSQGANIKFYVDPSDSGSPVNVWTITGSGDFVPEADETYSIGSEDNKLETIYVNKLPYKSTSSDPTTGEYRIPFLHVDGDYSSSLYVDPTYPEFRPLTNQLITTKLWGTTEVAFGVINDYQILPTERPSNKDYGKIITFSDSSQLFWDYPSVLSASLDITKNENQYIPFLSSSASSGSIDGRVVKYSTGFTWNPNTTTLTATKIAGNITGDLTGSVLGDITGDLTGSVLGDLTGSVLGDVTGSLTGSSIDVDTIIFGATEVTASGAEINHLSGVTSPIQGQISAKQDELTFGIGNTNAVKIDSGTVTAGKYAVFTADGLDGANASDIKQQIGLDTTDSPQFAHLTASSYQGAGSGVLYISSKGPMNFEIDSDNDDNLPAYFRWINDGDGGHPIMTLDEDGVLFVSGSITSNLIGDVTGSLLGSSSRTEKIYVENKTTDGNLPLLFVSSSDTSSYKSAHTEVDHLYYNPTDNRLYANSIDIDSIYLGGTVITASVTEINYLDGVSSNIQTQIDTKQDIITGAATTITGSNLTPSRVLISNASGSIEVSAITSIELGYLDGVSSNIQDQITNLGGGGGGGDDVSLSNLKTRLSQFSSTDLVNIGDADNDTQIVVRGNLYSTGSITLASDSFFEGDLNGAVTIDVYNDTASTLPKGAAVYLTGGNNGDTPHVELADNDDSNKMPALGIIKNNIASDSIGQVVTAGIMNYVGHGHTLGSDLYVSSSAGGLTTDKPNGQLKLLQKIGKVVSSGHILVQGAFRTNAVPNLDEGNIFVGRSGNAEIESLAENVQDIVGAQIATNGSHTAISASYDDAGDGAIDLSITGSLLDIHNLTHADGNIIVSDGTYWVTESGPTARTSLGLGTSDKPSFDSLTLVNYLTASLLGNVTGSILGDVTGDVTGSLLGDVTGNVTGDLTGDVTGSLLGDVIGDVTGNLTGDVTGSLLGDVTGDLTGSLTGSSIDVDTIIFGATEVTASGAEINYLTGVSSAIQTQLDAKAPLADPTFTGTVNAGHLVLSGNLTVNGTTTTINSTTLTVDDKNIILGSVDSPTDATANGGGITLKGLSDKTLNWVSSSNSWTSSENFDIASGKVFKIGTSDVLSSTNLGSSIVSSSLNTLGTIGTGIWQGTAIANSYIASAATWDAKLNSSGTIANNDYSKFDANGNLVGRSYDEVKTDLLLDNVENTAISTWAGSTNITTLGTIGTGTWQGTAITDNYISSSGTWNAKQATITGAATTVTGSDLAENLALLSDASGKIAVSDITSTELGYLDGVSSNIQTQLDAKHTKTLSPSVKVNRNDGTGLEQYAANVSNYWIKIASASSSNLQNNDTLFSSLLVTFSGYGTSDYDGDQIYQINVKFTGYGASPYYYAASTYVTVEPLHAGNLESFDPTTDVFITFNNSSSTSDVELWIKNRVPYKDCFVSHIGGTNYSSNISSPGLEILTDQSYISSGSMETAISSAGLGNDIYATYTDKIFKSIDVDTITFGSTEVTASGAEINYLTGVSSSIQTQLDSKQAYHANLANVSGLSNSNGNFIVGNGSAFVAESGATARASLGLGSISTQDSNSVSITGGSVTGITNIAITGDLVITGSIVSPANNDLTLSTSGTGNIVLDSTGGDGVIQLNGMSVTNAGVTFSGKEDANVYINSDANQIYNIDTDGNGDLNYYQWNERDTNGDVVTQLLKIENDGKLIVGDGNAWIKPQSGYMVLQSYNKMYFDIDIDGNDFGVDYFIWRHDAASNGNTIMALQSEGNLLLRNHMTINYGNPTGSESTPSAPLQIKCSTATEGIRLEDYNSTNYWKMYLSSTSDRLTFDYNGTLYGGYLVNNVSVGQITFTGQHRSKPGVNTVSEYSDKVGLIVVSCGEYTNISDQGNKIRINEAHPNVILSSVRNQKSVYGVISDNEDSESNTRSFTQGSWVTTIEKPEGDDRLIINSLGEGGIWITNVNGNLENGDYITTCEIPGYGMKQDSEFLANYTVAKITCDCDFDLNSTIYDCEEFVHEGVTYRRAFVGCTYHCG